ncbi:MAG: hypothetical protein ACRCUJ_14240 [Phocaeicola sp.]
MVTNAEREDIALDKHLFRVKPARNGKTQRIERENSRGIQMRFKKRKPVVGLLDTLESSGNKVINGNGGSVSLSLDKVRPDVRPMSEQIRNKDMKHDTVYGEDDARRTGKRVAKSLKVGKMAPLRQTIAQPAPEIVRRETKDVVIPVIGDKILGRVTSKEVREKSLAFKKAMIFSFIKEIRAEDLKLGHEVYNASGFGVVLSTEEHRDFKRIDGAEASERYKTSEPYLLVKTSSGAFRFYDRNKKIKVVFSIEVTPDNFDSIIIQIEGVVIKNPNLDCKLVSL